MPTVCAAGAEAYRPKSLRRKRRCHSWLNLIMPGVALAEQLYRCVQAQGHTRDGTQALILALAEMTGVEWKGGRMRDEG